MTNTLASIYDTLVSLSGLADDSTTITTAGQLNAGLYADSLSAAWTITNAGSVLGAGIGLASAGTVVNAGYASGGLYGILLEAGGFVTNQSRGSIFGFAHAVYAHGVATVANYGTITSGTNHATVLLLDGGRITNAPGGLIQGNGGTDIYITGAGGTVANAGVISASTSANGINLHLGGLVSNATGGTISAAQRAGIYIVGEAGTVVNDGVILSALSTAVVLESGGAVTNASNGSIIGNFGIYAKTGAATILNAGLIEASTTGGNGIGLLLGGYVSNATSGTISALHHAGLYVGGATATVVNAGLITSNTKSGVDLNKGGTITNRTSATITGYYGVFVAGAAGTVINAGWISAFGFNGDVIRLIDGGYVSNIASGTLSGLDSPGIRVTGGLGSVTNSGSIGGLDGIDLWAGGAVVNNAGAVISGPGSPGSGGALDGNGVFILGGIGTVTNSGIIGGLVTGVDLGAGGVVNNSATGTIAIAGSPVESAVLVASGSGSVLNAGMIAAAASGGEGVALLTGGYVSNAASGTISAPQFTGVYIQHGASATVVNAGYIGGINAIYARYASGTVVNFGEVSAANSAIRLSAGGLVSNATSGMITGDNDYGVRISGGTGTVVNAGQISGWEGVHLNAGGTVINYGTIGNTQVGDSVYIAGASGGVVVNAGLVGNVHLATGGNVTNQTGGTIFGVNVHGAAGTVVSAGTINNIYFAGTYANRVVVDPGAVFTGGVGGGGTLSTLELAAGASTGTLSGLGSQYINFAHVTIDTGAIWTLTGSNTLATGASLTTDAAPTNAGTLTLLAANLTDDGALTNNGAIQLDLGTMTVTGLIGSGQVTIAADSTLEVQGTVSKGETIVFGAGGALLKLDAPGSVGGMISRFTPGETIDLAGVDPSTVVYAAGNLTFAQTDSSSTIALQLTGSGTVQAVSDDSGGTDLVMSDTPAAPLTPLSAPPISSFPSPVQLPQEFQQFVATNQLSIPDQILAYLEPGLNSLNLLKGPVGGIADGVNAITGGYGIVSAVADGSFTDKSELLSLFGLGSSVASPFLPESQSLAVDAVSTAVSLLQDAEEGDPIAAGLDINAFIWGDLFVPAAKNFAKDPPDPDYTSVFVPQMPDISFPGVSSDPTLTGLIDTANQHALSAAVYLDAAEVSFDRYSSAWDAGDAVSALLQLEGIVYYLSSYENSASESANDISALLSGISASGNNLPTFNLADFESLIDTLSVNGFDPTTTQFLENLGLDSEQIQTLLATVTSLTPPAEPDVATALSDLSVDVLGTVPNKFNWDGGDGDYSAAVSWSDSTSSTAGPPTNTDEADFVSSPGTIAGTGSASVISFGGTGVWVISGTLTATTINATAPLNIPGQITAQTVINVSADVTVSGTVEATGASPSSVNPAVIEVGPLAGSDGSISVSGTSAVVSTNGNPIIIGDSGRGSVLIKAGGALESGVQPGGSSAAILGSNAGGEGSLNVTDIGSTLSAIGQLDVGGIGDGSLLVQNQATVTTGASTANPTQGFDIAVGSDGSGQAIVTGSQSLLLNVGRFIVGDNGLGSLSIASGGSVITAPGTVVGLAGAVIANSIDAGGSSVNVTGAGSDWQVAGALNVGSAATGLLAITNGASVSATTLDAGDQASGAGIVTISGPNADLVTTGTVTIGDAGSGELSILDGANATIGGDLNVANAGTGTGNVDIEDTTGTITFGGNILVGFNGFGVFNIGFNVDYIQNNGGIIFGPDSSGAINSFADPSPFLSNSSPSPISIGAQGVDQLAAYLFNSGEFTIPNNHSLTFDTPIISGGGSFALGSGDSLVLNADTVAGQTFTLGSNDKLTIGIDQLSTIDLPASGTGPFTPESNPNKGDLLLGNFGGVIANFTSGDTIDVDTYLSSASAGTLSQNGAVVSVIEIANGATLGVLRFDTAANATAAIADDAITLVPCFAAGTRIATARGEVAVETIEVGDRVQVLLGDGFSEVIWVGRRDVDCADHPTPRKVWPVLVSAGAFGPGRPYHELFLSPDHAVYINDVLIPVKHLINGSTIAQVPVQRVTYHHIELAAHNVLLAEGLPAESFLDMRDGSNYANRPGPIRLYPDFSVRMWEAFGCARLVVTGPELEAARVLVAGFASVQKAA